MHSRLADFIKDTPDGLKAQNIIGNCVHCGFCNAACPTYRLQGDELDGPRGRIYLLKNFLEGGETREKTRQHLDRCLGCGACESACPSGVKFTRLADIGRGQLEQRLPRPWRERVFRGLLLAVLPYPRRVKLAVGLGLFFKPLLPNALKRKLPAWQAAIGWPEPRHSRQVLILPGCVQSVLAPQIDAGAAELLDKLGISAIPAPEGCCGALSHHLADPESLARVRRNIDLWWPYLEDGAEALVITASGCALMVREYGELLADDPAYAEKAARISASVKDMSTILAGEDLTALAVTPRRIAFQSPCTLQHGLGLDGRVEALLTRLGFTLVPVNDSGLCCGSAGAYSLLQPKISGQLRRQKLAALEAENPELIATANIGCLLHLREQARVPVLHWLELLEGRLG